MSVVKGERAVPTRRVGLWLTSSVAAALVVGGCGDATEPPSPTSAPPTTPSVAEPAPGEARDIAAFTAGPCGALMPSQLAALGLVRPQVLPRNSGAPNDGRGPVTCYAERPVPGAPATEPTDDVTIFPAPAQDTLAVATGRVLPPDVVMPLSLQGLPAALVVQPDLYQRCVLEVRTAPGQGFEVFVGRTRKEVGDTCDVARAVGDAVVANLPRR